MDDVVVRDTSRHFVGRATAGGLLSEPVWSLVPASEEEIAIMGESN